MLRTVIVLLSAIGILQTSPCAWSQAKVSFLVKPQPEYPHSALTAGYEGRCEATMTVNADGSPNVSRLSCSHEIFRQSALDAARSTRFEMNGAIPPNTSLVLPLTFKMDDDKAASEVAQRLWGKYARAQTQEMYGVIFEMEDWENDGHNRHYVAEIWNTVGREIPGGIRPKAKPESLYASASASLEFEENYVSQKEMRTSAVFHGCRESWNYTVKYNPSKTTLGDATRKLAKEVEKNLDHLTQKLSDQGQCSEFQVLGGYRAGDLIRGAKFGYNAAAPTVWNEPSSRELDRQFSYHLGAYLDLVKSRSFDRVSGGDGFQKLSDLAVYQLLSNFASVRDRIASEDSSFFSLDRTIKRTIPDDGTRAAWLFHYDPDLLAWAVDLGIFDAATIITGYGDQLKSDHPELLALLEQRAGDQVYTYALVQSAFRSRNRTILKIALESGFPVRGYANGERYDFLASALLKRDEKSFREIAAFDDVNAIRNGTTLLHLAMPSALDRDGDRVSRRYLEHYVSVSEEQSDKMLDMLSDAGIDFDVEDVNGRTAMEDLEYRIATQDRLNRSEARAEAAEQRAFEEQGRRNREAYERLMGLTQSIQQDYDRQRAQIAEQNQPDWRRRQNALVERARNQRTNNSTKRSTSNSEAAADDSRESRTQAPRTMASASPGRVQLETAATEGEFSSSAKPAPQNSSEQADTQIQSTFAAEEEREEANSCFKPRDNCVLVADERYDPDIRKKSFKVVNRCDQRIYMRWTIGSGGSASSALAAGKHYWIDGRGVENLNWSSRWLSFVGSPKSSEDWVCMARTDLRQQTNWFEGRNGGQ